MYRIFILAIVAVALAGCAIGWSRPNTTQADAQQDIYECQRQAASMYPVAMQSVGSGYTSPSQSNCSTYGTQTTCTTIPGRYTPPPQTDVNATNRTTAQSSCLQAKGYTYKMEFKQ